MSADESGRAVRGNVADGFGPVADAFAANFADADEVGAAVAVYAGGDLVVDLWGGMADPVSGATWQPDSLSVIFSCSKGIVTLCVYLLVQDGLVDLDAPMATYWPEFAQNGKSDVSVRTVLSHRAGLPTVDAPLTFEDVLAWTPVVDALAAQRPRWEPGTGFFYHALTFGWLGGELIRRVSGLMPGEFLTSRLTGPLGLETWIGLPADQLARLVPIIDPTPTTDPAALAEEAVYAATEAATVGDESVSLGGAVIPAGSNWSDAFNRPEIALAQLPGGNGISTARSLAALYSAAVHGPETFPLGGLADGCAGRPVGRRSALRCAGRRQLRHRVRGRHAGGRGPARIPQLRPRRRRGQAGLRRRLPTTSGSPTSTTGWVRPRTSGRTVGAGH